MPATYERKPMIRFLEGEYLYYEGGAIVVKTASGIGFRIYVSDTSSLLTAKEGDEVSVGIGRYGYYVLNQKKFISIPDTLDPYTLTLEQAIDLIENKRQSETDRHIKSFDEEPELEVVNGRFGPYMVYKGTNYHLSKPQQKRAAELTLEECMNIIKERDERPKSSTTTRRRYTRKK